MGNGLLTSMALTDAWENQSLNRGLSKANTRIEELQNTVDELEGSVAANLLEKCVLRRALAQYAPQHPLLQKVNQTAMHSHAKKIIAMGNSSFDDVRAAAERVNF